MIENYSDERVVDTQKKKETTRKTDTSGRKQSSQIGVKTKDQQREKTERIVSINGTLTVVKE
jgi:hypothetical protein